MTASKTTEEMNALVEYAATADIGGDPLVIDLADTVDHLRSRILVESDLAFREVLRILRGEFTPLVNRAPDWRNVEREIEGALARSNG